MSASMRLLVISAADPQTVRLQLSFAAPERGEITPPANVSVDFGDGQVGNFGLICPPTTVTWRGQWTLELAEHTYTGLGPYTVRLLWGQNLLEAQATPGFGGLNQAPSPKEGPTLQAFSLDDQAGRPMERLVRVQVRGLPAGTHLRLDSGTGQVFWLSEPSAPGGPSERRLTFAKTGFYTVALDVLDEDGFWLQTLAEHNIEVTAWHADTDPPAPGLPVAPAAPILVGDQPIGLPEPGERAPQARPWLPYRYARPLWGWVRTYANPGGTTVARILAMGTYLSIRDELLVGNRLWYQTASRDWIPAGALDAVRPSGLRGVALQPAESRARAEPTRLRGLVTAPLLNVRERPGVRADNPPSSQLGAGVAVDIYDEVRYGGSTWYCLGDPGWVCGGFVHLVSEAGKPAAGLANPGSLPIGWVIAPALNVRARPGTGMDNPPVDLVAHNQALTILDTYTLGSQPWYAVGQGRWVDGLWIGAARAAPRPAAIGADQRWLAVSLNDQTAVAYEGDRPVYALLIAAGLNDTPTPAGIFRTYRQVEAGRISGGNPAWGSYYDLEDVPWLCYFHGGYALVGAYWHDSFGRAHSHGCINLSPYDAWWIYHWSTAKDLVVYIY
jgi:hypothetical protein